MKLRLSYLANQARIVCIAVAIFAAQADSAPNLPLNLYRETGRLPGHFKRVALLPVTSSTADDDLDQGRTVLGPVLRSAILASRRFEVVTVTPEECRSWTGRTSWLASDTLPQDFFARIRKETGCDGVMFAELTVFRAYPKVAIGWRLQLVDTQHLRTWWAVDEVFDAEVPAVARAARQYYREHFATAVGADSDSILISPRRFGEFSANVLTVTLPIR